MASSYGGSWKGWSEFCVTVGTVTRTASILIHSRLKALAINLSQPSGWLWLYAGLIGFNNPSWLKADLVVCTNLSSPSSCVWVGEHFFCYRLTRAVPDKGLLNGWLCGRVCVCILPNICKYFRKSKENTIDSHTVTQSALYCRPILWHGDSSVWENVCNNSKKRKKSCFLNFGKNVKKR